MRHVAVLGATGSIGSSTLDVIARHPARFAASVLAAHSKVDELVALCVRFRPRMAVTMSKLSLLAGCIVSGSPTAWRTCTATVALPHPCETSTCGVSTSTDTISGSSCRTAAAGAAGSITSAIKPARTAVMPD